MTRSQLELGLVLFCASTWLVIVVRGAIQRWRERRHWQREFDAMCEREAAEEE